MCSDPSLRVRVPAPHSLPAGGRLSHFGKQWQGDIRTSHWHRQALKSIPLHWESTPPENRPFDSAVRFAPDSKERLACRKTLQHYLEVEAIRPLPSETTGGHWSTFFPVPKKGSDKMRGCIDLREPNNHLEYLHFKMEGLHTLAQMLRKNDYMTKVDLSDFYFHFRLHQTDRRFMRFMWEGVKYECLAMPFGLAPAPRIATKMLAPVIRHLRSKGLRVVVYLDDILCLARSFEESIRHSQILIDTLHNLGFGIHPDKVQVTPSRSIEFLGTQVNSRKMQFRVPRDKIRGLRREIIAVRQANENGLLTVRRLASLLGKMNSLRGAVVSAQLHLWPLHHLLKDNLCRTGWKGQARLDQSTLDEMQWWYDQMHLWSGKSIIPSRCQMVVTTDASSYGWGGWWRTFGQTGKLAHEARGFWASRKESRMSSNARELTAVLFTVKAAAGSISGRTVLVETDNTATRAYINHLGGRSRFLNNIARNLWLFCYSRNISLQAIHRPGVVNQRADKLSRWKQDHTDIRLDPQAFRQIDDKWGPHSVDLFATRTNTQLSRFVSWRPDPESIATDAFQFTLKGENAYCFPPVACIPQLLREILHQQATITLVAPAWEAPWSCDLRRLLVDTPMPLSPNCLFQVRDRKAEVKVSSEFRHWNLTSYRISGSFWRICNYRQHLSNR